MSSTAPTADDNVRVFDGTRLTEPQRGSSSRMAASRARGKPDPVEMGVLLENLAAASLHTLALHEGVRLHHWREGKDEVDLVLDHPTRPLAFEIGSSARHSARGLFALQHRHRRFAGRCYLVAPDAPVRRPGESTHGVGSIPLDRFLVAVGRQAEEALDLTLNAPAWPTSTVS